MKTNLRKLLLENGNVLYGKLILCREYNDYEHDWVYTIYVFKGWDGELYYNFTGEEKVVEVRDLAYVDYLIELEKHSKKLRTEYHVVNRSGRRNNWQNELVCQLPF